MPIVKVSMLKGRTKDQKIELAKAITDAMANIVGAKPDHIWVVFDEVERENWAMAGKLLG